MSHALTRRLQRLEAQAHARRTLALAPMPAAEAAAVAHVHALLAQYETPLTAVERAGLSPLPLEQRSLAERLARLLGMTMPELKQWMHIRARPSA
jgi:hypothetical protein